MVDLLLLGEDKTHAALLGFLAREVVKEEATVHGYSWVLDNLDSLLTFHGEEDLSVILPGLRYTSTLREFQPIGPGGKPIRRLGGHIDGLAAGPESTKWRRVLLTVLKEHRGGVLIARDTDGDRGKMAGLRNVVDEQRKSSPGLLLLVAAPHQDAESWLVTGFSPSSGETSNLKDCTRDIGFDPTQQPERLTAHPNDSPRDAKRVLRRLLGLEAESRALNLEELGGFCSRLLGDLERLRARGYETGVTDFLEELKKHLPPLFWRVHP